jgi:hypothetical protein
MTQNDLAFLQEACVLKINTLLQEIVDNSNKEASKTQTEPKKPNTTKK